MAYLVNTNKEISFGKYKKFQKCVQKPSKSSKKEIFSTVISNPISE